MPPKRITWVIDLTPLMKKRLLIETKEGFMRDGILTQIVWVGDDDGRKTTIDTCEVAIPEALILNGEISDPIPFLHIREIQRIASHQPEASPDDVDNEPPATGAA